MRTERVSSGLTAWRIYGGGGGDNDYDDDDDDVIESPSTNLFQFFLGEQHHRFKIKDQTV